MKKLFFPTTLFLLALFAVGAPTLVFATAPSETAPYKASYVPCGTDDVNKDGKVDNPCGFADVIEMAKRLITGWIMAGVTFATMGFAYAGYLYITAMGSSEKISHAHSIFTKTTLGFIFMLSAWLIAYTMESIFLTDKAKENSFLQP
ncbi:MAG: hypothetical protein Q7R64_00675 [bacterium]|nr:hypothetical protein [bacterium]